MFVTVFIIIIRQRAVGKLIFLNIFSDDYYVMAYWSCFITSA